MSDSGSSTIDLTLKPGEERRLLAGHAWVFSNELQALPATVEPGTLALLHTSRGRCLGVGFFNPKSLIAFRLLSREPAPVDAGFFKDRLERCLYVRRRHLGKAVSFRAVFGEADGLPGLVVDKYEEHLVVQVLGAGIEARLNAVRDALLEVFSPTSILLRNDHASRGLEGLQRYVKPLYGDVPEKVFIEENGLKFAVTPAAGQKTGFFFDQRENRAALIPYVKHRTVLDLYCYSGAFSVLAAKHGAARVFGMDSSEAAIALADENAGLNGVSDVCAFEAGDADEVLASFAAARREMRPDLVILDPPGLVPSKKHKRKALRTYARLNANAFRCLTKGGLVATSSCSHHLSREDFIACLREAAGKAQKRVHLLELRGQAKDHPILLTMPETEYLHFALLEVG